MSNRLKKGKPIMTATQRTLWLGGTPSRLNATFVGAYYVLTVVTCVFIFYWRGRLAFAADTVLTVIYLAITALFYTFSKARGKEKAR